MKEISIGGVLWRKKKKQRMLWSCIYTLLLLVVRGQCSVTYDSRALVIDGEKKLLFSGSIHYTRSTPEMWEDLIQKAKDGGLDVIETYVFWDRHEPFPGQYDFEWRNDLVRFVKTIQKVGLYAHLRIGPYVCAEWNFGGFPVWLKDVPGIRFRTDNEPFKMAMQGFTTKIVNLMKIESLFQPQGGPIILCQIENEYGVLSEKFGKLGKSYVKWAADMAVNLDTGVPWVMCKEDDAPDPIINTCNGFYCENFKPNQWYKPKMWTEAWTGWYSEYRVPQTKRPVKDLAYAVAKFIQKGGSLVNYYMYHGGTNFGRTAGGPFITTSYDYDAPLDEYGLKNQPKYAHLAELHKAVKKCEQALVDGYPQVTELGKFQQAYTFLGSERTCAFLSNNDYKSSKVLFNDRHYPLPLKSISILLDCKHVVFNTANVRVQTSQMEMIPTDERFAWEAYDEDLTSLGGMPMFAASGLLEQISVTKDITDYLWYTTTLYIDPSETFLQHGDQLTLNVQSTGHQMQVYVNGEHQGFVSGLRRNTKVSFVQRVPLQAGTNTISLLSVAVGLANIGSDFENRKIGVTSVTVNGLDEGRRNLSSSLWNYQIGLKGEYMNLAYPDAFSQVDWTPHSLQDRRLDRRLTWYKAHFDGLEGVEPVALDMLSMGKGQVWINGQSIGRYWTAKAVGNCTGCSSAVNFQSTKCQTGCGEPTQRYYHIPLSFLRPTGNVVVIIEELGGDISGVRLVKRSVTSICSTVSEYHPNYFKNMETENYGGSKFRLPKLKLHCDRPQDVITAITFASFGTPQGKCGSLRRGNCHALASLDISEKSCVGFNQCAIAISTYKFGDPCSNVLKRLAVEAVCGPSV